MPGSFSTDCFRPHPTCRNELIDETYEKVTKPKMAEALVAKNETEKADGGRSKKEKKDPLPPWKQMLAVASANGRKLTLGDFREIQSANNDNKTPPQTEPKKQPELIEIDDFQALLAKQLLINEEEDRQKAAAKLGYVVPAVGTLVQLVIQHVAAAAVDRRRVDHGRYQAQGRERQALPDAAGQGQEGGV